MITGIEIDSREKVLFLPFKQNHDSYKKNKEIEFQANPQSFLESVDYLFSPYLLPICGTYDTYGRIEDIERNENVEAIEAHFGISIDAFIHILTCSREFGSSLSELSTHFLSRNVFDIQNNYGAFPDLLEALGFTSELSGETYVSSHPKCSFTLQWTDDENNVSSSSSKYTVRLKNGKELKKHDNYNHDLFALAISEDDFFLGVDDEKQAVVRELYGLSGAFIYPKIYETLSASDSNNVSFTTTLSEVRDFYKGVSKSDFTSALDEFEIFMKNLRHSNRVLSLSKYVSEWESMERAQFHLGLLEVIKQEVNRI